MASREYPPLYAIEARGDEHPEPIRGQGTVNTVDGLVVTIVMDDRLPDGRTLDVEFPVEPERVAFWHAVVGVRCTVDYDPTGTTTEVRFMGDSRVATAERLLQP